VLQPANSSMKGIKAGHLGYIERLSGCMRPEPSDREGV
jgi:hypothetical protein